MDSASQVQIVDKALYILFCSNAHRKGMNSSLLLPAMSK